MKSFALALFAMVGVDAVKIQSRQPGATTFTTGGTVLPPTDFDFGTVESASTETAWGPAHGTIAPTSEPLPAYDTIAPATWGPTTTKTDSKSTHSC